VRLAEAIMESNDRSNFLEAELHLQQLLGDSYRLDPDAGGRALAALAQLEEKKGSGDSMKLAAAYYRRLAQDFPTARVRQGKTGKDLFNELATDKRFLPFLEDASPGWGPAPLKAREINGATIPATALNGFILSPAGDQTPFARRHRLVIDRGMPNNPTVRLVDIATGRDRWERPCPLGQVPENQQIFFYLYQQANLNPNYHPNARFRFFQVKGHLIVFQVGVMVYCLDGDKGTKLWEQTTVEGLKNQPNLVPQQVMSDTDGNPEFILWNQMNNQRMRIALGYVAAVEASYVALVTQKGLTVNDPLRGTLLWSRAMETPGARIFGDEQHLFLIEGSDGAGAGRVLRANDGEVLKVPDFGSIYQNRIRVLGKRILAAVPGKAGLSLKLYDILAGKDVWSKDFPTGSVVLQTEDRDLTGVIDPKGQLIALEADSGQEVLSTSVLQGRNVTLEDVKNLKEPLLLQDRDHFYVALNQPIDNNKIAGSLLHTNFNNGLRCRPINVWFLALYRQDGQKQVDGQLRKHTRGQIAWDSFEPLLNQMLVMEQFDQLPVLIFTSRYNELINGGAMGNKWVSDTKSFARNSGSLLYPLTSRALAANGMPQYASFQVDQRAGTITLYSGGQVPTLQLYLDDGRTPPPVQESRVAPAPLDPNAAALLQQEQLMLQQQLRLQQMQLRIQQIQINGGLVPVAPPPPPLPPAKK
jgi:hypothetical protein